MRFVRPLRTPADYVGQSTVAIGPGLSDDARQASRIITEWCRFFESGPTDILDLTVGRTSQRLFDAIGHQTQLRRLAISWGPFDGLSRLDGMSDLAELSLGSATSLTSIDDLRGHTRLVALELRNARRIHDYSAIGELAALRQLTVDGGTADSIEFVRYLKELRLLNFWLKPADLDFSALLDLTWVEQMDVKEWRGMRPSAIDLEWALPGIQRRSRDVAEGITYEWRSGERIGDYRDGSDGRRGLYRYDIEGFVD